MVKKNKGKSRDESVTGGLTGFLGGLTQLIEKLGDLAEKGKELSEKGELSDLGMGKQLKGVYGFNVKVGLGDDKVKIEPFGNIKHDLKTGETVVQEIREPMVDIFEEEDHVLVVAELPGVGSKDVHIDIKDDVLTIQAQKKDKKYRKEVLLPGSFSKDKIEFSCNNGILEIKCHK
jgi:HSP20 family protein